MQARKITKKILFSLAALSFLALAALPVGAQVTQTESCTLVKDVDVNIVSSGANDNVVKIYSGSVVSSKIDKSETDAAGPGEMNGSKTTLIGNIAVQIVEGNTADDGNYGAIDLRSDSKGPIPGFDDETSAMTAIAKQWGIICLMNTINTIINWISLIVLILSTALIIYAGFLWMTGGDNPEFKTRAGKVILAALIGFGIVILARVLPAVISGILL